jgi:hypothetical protein
VYLVIVFLSVILPMLLLSSKLKRKIIIAQNLTYCSGLDRCYLCLEDLASDQQWFLELQRATCTGYRDSLYKPLLTVAD